MGNITPVDISIWPLWKKILFRFFFIYAVLEGIPWLLSVFPGIRFLKKYHHDLMDWAVTIANANVFHVRAVLMPVVQNKDTSWAWAQQWLFLCIAIAGCGLWSLLDRRKKNYAELNYWLCVFTRYCIAIVAFNYGIEKIFALQIPFPGESLLATPVGDLLPMRLYWVSIGYSSTYQIFAGLMEVLTGSLLLYRKTVTLGALLGLAVFSNIMIINFSYDVPVKIISINLILFCLFLIANEYKRIVGFFVLNKPVPVSRIYDFFYPKRWMRAARVVLKVSFILVFAWNFYRQWQRYNAVVSRIEAKTIKNGIYDVAIYTLNGDTIPPSNSDSMRWQNVIFEKGDRGSVKTADTSFRQLYNRGYFTFEADTSKHIINFKKGEKDSAMYDGIILSLYYQIPDSNTIQLWGKKKNDSLSILLKRSNRHFLLTEKQFNWITEHGK